MGYASILSSLLQDGRVRLADADTLSKKDISESVSVLTDFERLYRMELPGKPPPLNRSVAQWASVLFYRACQFVVFRDVSATIIEAQLSVPCPESPSASVCYSVDLSFRFLRDLLRFARAAAENDPLVKRLLDWAKEWPLSSVGIANLPPVEIDAFVNDPCLFALYIDRVLACRDTSRLSDLRVRKGVEVAVGLHTHLASDFMSTLKNHQAQEAQS